MDEYGRFAEAVDAAVRGMRTEVHARQVRVRAHRFLEYCRSHHLDPFVLSTEQWAGYVADAGWPSTRAAKERSAVRQVLRIAGVLDDEHGLGTGNQRWRLDSLGGREAGHLVDTFVNGRYPHRAQVARSALAKLATWCDTVGIPIEAIRRPDIEDFDFWVRHVGGQREILVVARDWAEFLEGAPSIRR